MKLYVSWIYISLPFLLQVDIAIALVFALPLVFHDSLFLLARTVAVTVEPLLPPHPTIMRPTLGTLFSVRNVIWVLRGEACQHEVLDL